MIGFGAIAETAIADATQGVTDDFVFAPNSSTLSLASSGFTGVANGVFVPNGSTLGVSSSGFTVVTNSAFTPAGTVIGVSSSGFAVVANAPFVPAGSLIRILTTGFRLDDYLYYEPPAPPPSPAPLPERSMYWRDVPSASYSSRAWNSVTAASPRTVQWADIKES